MNTITKLTAASVFLISGTVLQAGLVDILSWKKDQNTQIRKQIESSKLEEFKPSFYDRFKIQADEFDKWDRRSTQNQPKIFSSILQTEDKEKLESFKDLSKTVLNKRNYELTHTLKAGCKRGFLGLAFGAIGLGSLINMNYSLKTDNFFEKCLVNILFPNLIKIAMFPIRGGTYIFLGETPSDIIYHSSIYALTGAACLYGGKNLYRLAKLSNIKKTSDNANKIDIIIKKAKKAAEL